MSLWNQVSLAPKDTFNSGPITPCGWVTARTKKRNKLVVQARFTATKKMMSSVVVLAEGGGYTLLSEVLKNCVCSHTRTHAHTHAHSSLSPDQ